MAVPKRKLSRAKRDNRKSQIKIKPVGITICPSCQERIRPHIVCPKCGKYKGEQVLTL